MLPECLELLGSVIQWQAAGLVKMGGRGCPYVSTNPHGLSAAQIVRAAIREARFLAAVSHCNVVALKEAYRSGSGRVYLVMEYCEHTLGGWVGGVDGHDIHRHHTPGGQGDFRIVGPEHNVVQIHGSVRRSLPYSQLAACKGQAHPLPHIALVGVLFMASGLRHMVIKGCLWTC
jgi:hypothetical protein